MATQAEVGEHLGLSTRHIRTLIKAGVIPSAQGKGLDLDACRASYINYLRGRVSGQVSHSGELDQQEQRARLTFHQANIAELDEKQRRGELLPNDEVVQEVSEAIVNMKTRLLAIPSKAAPTLMGELSHSKIKGILDDLVREALQELYSEYADDSGAAA